MTPRLSVISITRNNLTGLRHTHESLRAQTADDYEWIVIDGASSDGTPAYLQGTGARWLSEPDSGIYDAMNKGMAMARGQYILFLNAGDALADARIIADFMREPQADFIYGDGYEGRFMKPARPHAKFLRGMFTYHQAMFYRRALVGALTYDTAYGIAADYKFTVQFMARCAAIHYWPRPICLYEPGGLSQTGAARGRRELAQIRRELKLCGPVTNALIVTAHTASWTLRRHAPRLYENWRKRV